MILLLIACIVIIFIFLVWSISVVGGTKPAFAYDNGEVMNYLESYPKYMDEPTLKYMLSKGMTIKKLPEKCNYTIIELAGEKECTSITVEKIAKLRPTVMTMQTEIDTPTPPYVLRIRDVLEKMANEEHESLVREAVYNTDVYEIVDGKAVLNSYTKTIELTVPVGDKKETYILFIQPDIGLLAHETCLDRTKPFEDKLLDAMKLHNDYFNHEHDVTLETLERITCNSPDNYIKLFIQKEEDIEGYKQFARNMAKDCYKAPCIKHKLYIELFKKQNIAKPYILEVAFKNRFAINSDHIKLFEELQKIVDNKLYDLYFPHQQTYLNYYYAYIRLDKHFKVSVDFIPNYGNIDNKPVDYANSINLTEFAYALKYKNFTSLYKPKLLTFKSGGGPTDTVKYAPLRDRLALVDDALIAEANMILQDKGTKILFVTLDVGFCVSFVTNTGHYFEFCNNTTFDYKSKQYFEKSIKQHFATCYDGIENREKISYYRMYSNTLPYSLVEFYKFKKPIDFAEKSASYVYDLFPAYQYTYKNYVKPFYRYPAIVDIINQTLAPGVVRLNVGDTVNKYNKDYDIFIRDDTFAYYFTFSRTNEINEQGQFKHNKKFKPANFQQKRLVCWVFYGEEYDKIVFEIEASGLDFVRQESSSNKILFKGVVLSRLNKIEANNLMAVYEKFKLYCKLNSAPNSLNTMTTSLIPAFQTLHIKYETNKNPFYIDITFRRNSNTIKSNVIYYDQALSKLKISENYYLDIETRHHYNLSPVSYYAFVREKNGGREDKIDNDYYQLKKFSFLFDIDSNKLVMPTVIDALSVRYLDKKKYNINVSDKCSQILKNFHLIVKDSSVGELTINAPTVKIKMLLIDRIKNVFKNNSDANVLVTNVRIDREHLYGYRKKISAALVHPYGKDPEISRKYQEKQMNMRPDNVNLFKNIYFDISKIDSNNFYDYIGLSAMVNSEELIQEGSAAVNKYLPDIIKNTSILLGHLKIGSSFTLTTTNPFPSSVYKLLVCNLIKSFNVVDIKLLGRTQSLICDGFKGNHFSNSYEYSYITVSGIYYDNKEFDIPTVSETFINQSEKLDDIVNLTSNYIISYYQKINNDNLVDNVNFEKIIYESLTELIRLLSENNIKYDKYYASIATDYVQEVYNKLITFNSTINSIIVNYEHENLIVNPSCEPYYYDYKIGERLLNTEKIYDHVDASKFSRMDEGRMIYQDFTLGVTKYLKGKKKYNIPVSNAFVKLWEIYQTHDVLNLNGINAFHMCEAPGQWIKTTEEYIYNIFRKKYGKHVRYDWFANSLNPHNKDNINKYGNDIIDDRYSLIKIHKSKWLFSADDTGDITKPENIRWYRERFRNLNLNLITGDAGLPINLPLSYLQKLDFAQCVLTLAVASRGANCVIKCFSPYMKSNPITLEATGFFVNLMYLYNSCFETVYLYKPFTSRPQSGEFYIVAKSFIEISEHNLEKLLLVLEDFNENRVFINKENIPENFEKLIKDFIERLCKHNIETLEMGAFIEQCLNDNDDVLNFKAKLKSKEIEKIHENKFRTFCQNFNLL